MSLITYNGITLPYPFTTRFSQEAVDDDVGRVDWCLTKFEIQVQCVLNANYMSVIAPTLSGSGVTNAAGVTKLLRTHLLKRRQQLSFVVGGVEMIPSKAGVTGAVDAYNGPKPVTCDIVALTSTTFLLNYHIVAHYWENYSGTNTSTNRPGNPVIFNRWTETVNIDFAEYSTRTRRGSYRIRSDNVEGVQADMVRSKMAVVGVPTGFLRESSSYTQDPDGVTIQYEVVDREVFKMPPPPAYKAEGEYTEMCTMNGAMRWGDVWVKLWGSKTTPQAELVEVAVAVCAIKLKINGAKSLPETGNQGTGFAMLETASVRTGMYDNWVFCHMRARMTARKQRLDGVGGLSGLDGFSANMVFTPGSTNATPRPIYKDRGTAFLLLQAAAYYDPSLRNTELGAGDAATDDNPITVSVDTQLNAGKPVGTAGKNPE